MTQGVHPIPKSRPRVKTWTPKVKTGCRTCKRRKIKCDETKPSCQRCLKAKLVCDGYDALPQTWIFEHPEQQESPTGSPACLESRKVGVVSESGTGQAASGSLSVPVKLPSADVRCIRCERPDYDCVCPAGPITGALTLPELAKRTASLGLQPSARYRTADEQYFFKYFMEVGAISVARSDISGTFWLNYFPRAAYHQDAIKDALLSSAKIFQTVSKHIFLQTPVQDVHPSALAYENRAIETLIREAPSVDNMLIASCSFWFGAISCGDWAKSLQHTYHALKIIDGVKDRSKHDQLVLRYTEILARANLTYFRITRGPCRLHPSQALTDCDALCFLPEATPVEIRVADACFHIRQALERIEESFQLLGSQAKPHKQHSRIVDLIKKQEREIRYLAKKWSDPEHLQMSAAKLAQAAQMAPITFSPFAPVHDALQDFIVKGEISQFSFGELELRMRVLLPNFMSATNQGHAVLLTDTCTVMFATTYIEGRKKLENEPGRKIVEKIVAEFDSGGDSPP